MVDRNGNAMAWVDEGDRLLGRSPNRRGLTAEQALTAVRDAIQLRVQAYQQMARWHLSSRRQADGTKKSCPSWHCCYLERIECCGERQMVKISFQTEDLELSLATLEYEYLNYFCVTIQRNSDEVLRAQVRSLTAEGVLSFQDWRSQQPPTPQSTQTTDTAPTATASAASVPESETTIAPAASNGDLPTVVKRRGGRPPKAK